MSMILSDAGAQFPDVSVQASAARPQIFAMPWSRAANALTIGSQQYSLAFKTSLISGVVATITGSPTALTIPAGASLGTVNGVQSSIIVAVLNNAGSLEYAVQNLAGGSDMSETGLISTTAISVGATSSNLWYSNTARTNVPYAVVARIDSTQTTAGTWASDPTLVQGAGGEALTAMSSLGYGQTWQSVTRVSGITYYNTTGRPIFFVWNGSGNPSANQLFINGVVVQNMTNSSAGPLIPMSMIVPPGCSYSFAVSSGGTASVYELR